MIAGPVILVEDDEDVIMIFKDVLIDLNILNRVVSFVKAEDAYHFLDNNAEQPFIIISDVNLPGMTGLEFKNKLDQNERLKKKSIPFIFFSTSANKRYLDEAYLQLSVQGYFIKEALFKEIKNQVRIIFEYWKICQHPNN